MPRANRTIAPIATLPHDLTGETLLYYLNTMIEQINTSFSDLDILESAVRGEDGYTATISSDLDVQGNTVMNIRSPTLTHEALPLGDARGLLDLLLPIGVILLWSGSIATIPPGWQLCDGTNGTPNLRDRFIVGAGTTYAVGATGGAAQINIAHTHTDGTYATDSQGAHTHTADGTLATDVPSATTTVDNDLALSTVAVASSTHTHDVTGNTSSNGAHTHDVTGASGSSLSSTQSILNPYYSLAYIMRVS
jgi:hypothetical protein